MRGFAGPMTTTLRSIRRRAGAVLAAGSVVAVLAGCSVDSPAVGDNTTCRPPSLRAWL